MSLAAFHRVSISSLPSHIPAWELPIWQAWFARHPQFDEVNYLSKLLAFSLGESDYQDSRPEHSRAYDNPYDRVDIDAMSIQTAHKFAALAATLMSQAGVKVKQAQK